MTYQLRNGGSVETFRVGDNIEFVVRTAEGRVTSTVQRTRAESVPLLRALTSCR